MTSVPNIPRIIIAATGSGAGKTTATVALLGALRARGLRVAAFKCGPDYLDPTYHARVLGKPSQNLDGWMMGREAVLATFARGAAGAEIAVIEGMMGLFDGARPDREEGSTAEIAKWLSAPVLLVHDASGVARTISAIAHGFVQFDSELRLGGLICNRVGSKGHLDLLRQARPAARVLGSFKNGSRSRPVRLPLPDRSPGSLNPISTLPRRSDNFIGIARDLIGSERLAQHENEMRYTCPSVKFDLIQAFLLVADHHLLACFLC